MPDSVSGSLGLRLLAVAALVLANAFFVASEFALVAVRRTRIEALVRRGDRKAKTVQRALQDLYRQLSAAQLGITVASILLGYVAQDTVAHLFGAWFAALPRALGFLARGGVASTVAVAVVSFLHVVFGEQAPKAWAITHPERVSRWVAAPLIAFSWITRPFTDLLNWSANRVVRRLGLAGASAELERIHSPEEIRMLVEQSRKTGRLEEDGARGDDPADRDGGPPRRPDARGGGRPGGRGGPVALPGVRGVARRHPRGGARQGHPRRPALGPRGPGGHAAHRAAPRGVRPRHPRGRGRARRHEAAEDPPRDRARRVRRHGGPGHHGRSAGGNRRPDLR